MEKQPTLFEPPMATSNVFKPAVSLVSRSEVEKVPAASERGQAPAATERGKAPAASGIKPNRSVPEADRERLTHQAVIVYRRLLEGPVTTGELVKIAAQYNARIKELRDWLREFGWTIDKISSAGQANNTYAIRPFHGSKYQATLMRRSRQRGKK